MASPTGSLLRAYAFYNMSYGLSAMPYGCYGIFPWVHLQYSLLPVVFPWAPWQPIGFSCALYAIYYGVYGISSRLRSYDL